MRQLFDLGTTGFGPDFAILLCSMLNLETLSAILDEFGGAPVSVQGEHCLNRRHKDAGCRLCVDACPTEAIRLQPADSWPAAPAETTSTPSGPQEPHLDAERCVNCGLCLHVCPTEVFTQRGAPETATAQTVALTSGEAIALVCPQHADPGHTRAPVSAVVRHKRCLAALSVSHLLELSDGGRRTLWLDDSPCAACPIGQVQSAIVRTATAANQLLQAFGRAPAIRTCRHHADALLEAPVQRRVIEGDRPELSRRHFFGALGHLARRTAATAIAESLPAPQPGGARTVEQRLPHRIPPQRMRLFRRLKRLGTAADTPISTATIPFANVLVNEEACSACKLCARFCPTGALHFAADEEGFALYFKPAICIDCGLCAVACPEDAVRFAAEIAPQALVADSWERLASGRLAPCVTCGAPTAVPQAGDAESTAVDAPRCYVCRRGAAPAAPLQDTAGLLADLNKRLASLGS